MSDSTSKAISAGVGLLVAFIFVTAITASATALGDIETDILQDAETEWEPIINDEESENYTANEQLTIDPENTVQTETVSPAEAYDHLTAMTELTEGELQISIYDAETDEIQASSTGTGETAVQTTVDDWPEDEDVYVQFENPDETDDAVADSYELQGTWYEDNLHTLLAGAAGALLLLLVVLAAFRDRIMARTRA